VSRYVLDSFAILAWYRREESALHVQQLIDSQQHQRWMTVVNLGEVYYRTAREAGMNAALEALDMVERLPIEFIDADRTLTLMAASIKARFALAYADCFAAALARRIDAAVVTGDPEFERLEAEDVVAIEWLPHRSRRRQR
jgi:ribonuclease VapC